MFLNPANKPTPNPIDPREPNVSVNLFTTDIIPFKPLMIEIIASEFAIFSIVSVHVFLRRFNEPYFIQQSSLHFASYNYNKSVD